MAKRHGLVMVGFGGDADLENRSKTKKVHYDFSIRRELSREDARTLMTRIMTDALEVLNKSEFAPEHMSAYPCTEENIGICIGCKNPDGSQPEPPSIYVFTGSGNGISYRTNTIKHVYDPASVYIESWEEVRRIQQQEQDIRVPYR